MINRELALAVTPKVGASLSLMGSLWIFFEVLTDREKRSMVYHRIIFMFALFDILESSITFFASSWLMVPPGPWQARGNHATCAFQGFVTQLGSGALFSYNAVLSIFYLLVIKYNIPERRLRKHEWALHIYPLSFGFILATTAAANNWLHNATLWCWIAADPACLGDEPTASPEYCEKFNADFLYIIRWCFFMAPVWFCFAIQFICLLIVFSVVRKMEKKAAGWNIGRHMRQAYNTGASAMASVTPNAKATTAAASKQRDVDKSYDGFTSLAISQAPKIEEIVPKQEESGGSASSKDKRSLDGFTSIAFSPPTDEEKKRDEPETILNTEEPVSPIHEEEEEEEDEIDGEDDDIILEEEEDDDDLEGEGEEEEEEVGNSSSRIRNKFRRRISQANSQGKVSLPRTKQVGTQALLYCLAFCFTYIFATVNRLLQAGGTSSWTILLLHTLSISMQGFWNVLIYRRPHYLKLRRTHGLTRWQSLQEAFKWTRFKSTSHKEDNGAGVYNRSSRIVTSLVAQSVRMLGQSRQDSAIIRQDSAIISRQDSAIISRQDSAIISRQDSTRIKKSETMTHPTQSTEGGGK